MLSNFLESFKTSPHRDIIASDNISYKVVMFHTRRDTYCMGFPSEALYIITPDSLTSP